MKLSIDTFRKILNVVTFELGWFACAASTAKGLPWIGIGTVILCVLLHLALSPTRKVDLRIFSLIALIGVTADSLLIASGAIRLSPEQVPSLMIPLWSLAFHVNFATTIRTSLAWLAQRPVASVFLGAMGGPLAFEAGRRLGAIDLGHSSGISLGMIGLAWALLTPFYFWISNRLSVAP